MPLEDIVGYLAGGLVLVSIVPQIVKSWRTKSTTDLSLPRYIIYVSGVFLWLVYGFILWNGPIITVNAINLCLASTVLTMKIKYG